MELLAILGKVQLFSGLNESQLVLVTGFLKEVSFNENEFIVHENTEGNTLFILIEGTVRVTKKLVMDFEGYSSEDKNLATLKADYLPFFGENGLVGSGMRNANVQAVTQCKMLQMTKQDFDNIADLDLDTAFLVMKNIATVLSGRLDKTDKNVVKLATALSLAVGR